MSWLIKKSSFDDMKTGQSLLSRFFLFVERVSMHKSRFIIHKKSYLCRRKIKHH